MDTPKKIGRYEILAELGHGAMGTVYRSKDPAMDRVVALKTITSVLLANDQGTETRERFFREARAAGALAHPGIVPVFDVGEHEGIPFLVMEFVTGKTLADAAKTGERMNLDRACEIGQKIAEALGYAHKHGVVHRDIKPTNILMTSREIYGIERPKITDFGVAKLAEGQTTMTGQMLGTPAFMPPEQFTGAPVDGRADIFSLGVVLYWMATGEQPFPGESMTAVSYKVVHTDPVPPRKLNPSVPAKLDAIIMKCLAKSPADRYQTGDELALDLSALRAGPSTTTLQSPAPRKSVTEIDPEDTVMVSTPVPAGRIAGPNQPVAAQPAKSHRDTWLILAAIIMAAVAGGGGYALRRPAKIADAPAPATVEATSTSPPLSASAPVPAPDPVSAAASDSAPAEPSTDKGVVTAAASAPLAAAPKKKPIPAAVPAPSPVAPTKPDAKTPVAAEPAPPPKVAEAAPTAGALGFDPTTLDPKQNAKLKIDASQLPAELSFTVEMNGKTYLRKADAATRVQDRDFFVPPGVQEFRVTASNGAIEKSSNTVSTEFKAKKKNTLKIELRTEGAPPGAGIPQGIYRDTQIVVNLK